jgi:thiosulfate dehydrogenase (quinone) large subunit
VNDRSTPRAVTPGLALLPLRLFLGVTFVYAGYQKLSDPGFLTPGSTTYIGSQLHGFAAGTPGGFVLRWFAEPFPRAAGVGVALAEIAIGLLTTAGLLTRAAAAAGLGLNLVLFLTASWHTSPYFLGSDIVFVFAWLPFVLAGASQQPAVDGLLAAPTATRVDGRRGRHGARVYATGVPPQTRRTLLRRGLVGTGAGTLGIAALATLLRGRSVTAASSTPVELRPRGTRRSAHHRAASRPSRTAHPLPAGAVRLGSSSQLPRGHAATYRDPHDGSPDIVVRQADGSLTAFSAICTHAGCEVAYQGNGFYCPCHGSEFDARTGAVLRGPAATPLPRRRIVERRGSIYAIT